MRRCKLQGIVAQRYGSEDRRFLAAYGDTDCDPMAMRLYVARKCSKLNRSAMAKALGVHESSVMRWECGEIHTISVENLRKWARVTGFDLRWMISGGEVSLPVKRMLRDMAPVFQRYIEPLPDSMGIPSTPEQQLKRMRSRKLGDGPGQT